MCWTLSSYCTGEKLSLAIVQNVIFFQFLLFIGADHPTLYQLFLDPVFYILLNGGKPKP